MPVQCGAAGKRFRQPGEPRDLAEFFRERFPHEFLTHLRFHDFGSFSSYRCSKIRFVEVDLREQLFDARMILGAAVRALLL